MDTIPSPAAIAAGRAFASPGREPGLLGVNIEVFDGRITGVMATGNAADAGDAAKLVMLPGLVNAHDHGRGLRHLAFGARDQSFELWRVALYAHPPVDVYLNAVLAFGRLLRTGVTAVTVVHSSIRVERLLKDAQAVAQAARDVGIRIAFVVPLRDMRTLGYGDDEALLARHPPQDHAAIRATWLTAFPTPADYIALTREIASRIEGNLVSVQLGPNSPQACSDALMEACAEESASSGRRITTHLLETSIQRQWADATYGEGGFIRHLDALGLLSPRFTGAHGVWLTPADCDLLAGRGSFIAVNTSSNLRLRSGVAPVEQFIRSGLRFCFGLDSFGVDDEDDAFRELRLLNWLHSPHHSKAPITEALLFDAAGCHGFESITGDHRYGRLTQGMPADFVLLDHDAMSRDLIADMTDDMDLLLTRATAQHVRHVYVAGRQVVRDGRVLGVDLAAVENEVMTQARQAGDSMRRLRPILERSQATLDQFYRGSGHVTDDRS